MHCEYNVRIRFLNKKLSKNSHLTQLSCVVVSDYDLAKASTHARLAFKAGRMGFSEQWELI